MRPSANGKGDADKRQALSSAIGRRITSLGRKVLELAGLGWRVEDCLRRWFDEVNHKARLPTL